METNDKNQEPKAIAKTCHCTLRTYPAEIRKMIFEFSLVTFTDGEGEYPGDQTLKENNCALIEALRPSPDLYQEALNVFWSKSPLVHDEASWNAFMNLGETAMMNIKSINIDVSSLSFAVSTAHPQKLNLLDQIPPNIYLAGNLTALTFRISRSNAFATTTYLSELLECCPSVRKLTWSAVIKKPPNSDEWRRLEVACALSAVGGVRRGPTKMSRAIFVLCYRDLFCNLDESLEGVKTRRREVYSCTEENDDLTEIWTWEAAHRERLELYLASDEEEL
ncbi:hypothetical protein HYFRA_00002384 [Hymenoscyphus fraxineus]|uniref:Uncharacterized protein n=1 Tax=Hymenoscyphus fraxineus TaxID=746836 RepID=A0A9N9Q0K5_9HELO|nr:hypothetical protein HYFRA_00002384 [Hymenoscyphus fraxineus]